MTGGYLIHYFGSQFEIYAIDAFGRLIFCIFLMQMNPLQRVVSKEKLGWESVVAGWRFVRRQPLILSTITLDMVAVLFGGATALLPIYAKDILHVGAQGLGPLRAAPAVGAIAMALFLTIRPPMPRAGRALLWAVAAFGGATIVFGLSRNFTLSLCALAALGAADNVSVVVRHTLVQPADARRNARARERGQLGVYRHFKRDRRSRIGFGRAVFRAGYRRRGGRSYHHSHRGDGRRRVAAGAAIGTAGRRRSRDVSGFCRTRCCRRGVVVAASLC